MTVRRTALLNLTAGITLLMAACTSSTAKPDQPTRVEVKKQAQRWVLLRNAEPIQIRGAGGSASYEFLRAIGGNSIRTWSQDDLARTRPNGSRRGSR